MIAASASIPTKRRSVARDSGTQLCLPSHSEKFCATSDTFESIGAAWFASICVGCFKAAEDTDMERRGNTVWFWLKDSFDYQSKGQDGMRSMIEGELNRKIHPSSKPVTIKSARPSQDGRLVDF
jgi:hypothetical protein